MVEGTLKRKQPPTFRHLPLNRAKKLKQTWVENKKIKTKWRAQQRKEGLSTALAVEREESGSDEEDEDDDTDGSASEAEKEPSPEPVEEPTPKSTPKPPPKKSTLHPSRAHIHPDLALKPKNPHPRRQKVEEDESAPTPSLRELTRQAYSRESLHTFKADPTRRGGARGDARGRGAARGRGRGGQHGETGRGQPNMKLRMDAMLEKIKQTVGQ
ncbi:hypothetical protein DXG03_001160 [Asterophora parasitica]|uniref:rRNA-processing protein FYV7 n=1 Tax=Asterophora parasitica TaxID=117018 RepID=A0A9P7KCS0_9AGAR|nr:hypothetical protein DXG03_001160 [Asterophora parasitica]